MTAHANVFFVRVVYESYPVVAFSLSNVTYQKEAVTSHKDGAKDAVNISYKKRLLT